jgi:hypothetical protein
MEAMDVGTNVHPADAIEVAVHFGAHVYAARIDGDRIEIRVDDVFIGCGVWRGGRIVDIDLVLSFAAIHGSVYDAIESAVAHAFRLA